MLNLAEYRKRPALLADWLPWAGLIASGVVLNKDGSFQRTARFRGPDLDSATQGELIATSARLNNALRRLGSGWALFVEAERRTAADYPQSDFPEPLSWLVDEERRAAFESEASHFESSYHLTLVYLPAEESSARAAKLLYENSPQKGVDWRERLTAFMAETDRFFDLLDGVMPEIAWLDGSQTLTYLHATVSTRRYCVRMPEHPFHLDALLVDSALVGGLAPMLGNQHLRVVSVRGFPTSTWPGLLDDLNRLGFAYRWSTRFICMDKAEAERTRPAAPPVVRQAQERGRAAARNHLPAGDSACGHRRLEQSIGRRCGAAGVGQRPSGLRLRHRNRDGARRRCRRGRREAAPGGACDPGTWLRDDSGNPQCCGCVAVVDPRQRLRQPAPAHHLDAEPGAPDAGVGCVGRP